MTQSRLVSRKIEKKLISRSERETYVGDVADETHRALHNLVLRGTRMELVEKLRHALDRVDAWSHFNLTILQ